VPLVTRALTVLSERDGAPPLGLLKTTMLQLDSTFDERSFGAGSFRDFTQKLEKLGAVKVQPGRGGWVVQPADAPPAGMSDGDAGDGATTTAASPVKGNAADHVAAPATLGSPADGVQAFVHLLKAGGVRRWPLYLRHVKQILRQAAPPLDERAYGFATVTDLVRAAQRDGLVRMERDRQGVVRVFQGPSYDAVVGSTSPGLQALPDRPAADVPTDVDGELPHMASAGPSERDAPVSRDMPEDAARDEPDTEMKEREAGPAPVEVPAPPKRRPNRGTSRRRAVTKK
jgi:hypothetical protein